MLISWTWNSCECKYGFYSFICLLACEPCDPIGGVSSCSRSGDESCQCNNGYSGSDCSINTAVQSTTTTNNSTTMATTSTSSSSSSESTSSSNSSETNTTSSSSSSESTSSSSSSETNTTSSSSSY